MAKFFIYWELEPTMIPDDPEERMKMWITMTEWTKADIEAGKMKDWGIRIGMASGYGISSEISEVELDQVLIKYMPYVKMCVNPVLTADENLEVLKKAAEMMRK